MVHPLQVQPVRLGRRIGFTLSGWWVLAALLSLAAPPAGARASGVHPAGPVVDLALEGRVDSLRAGLESGAWSGAEEALARALLEPDGLEAATRFERLTRSGGASPEQAALAWFHLYGYRRLIGDGPGAEAALEKLRAQPGLASRLFRGTVPEPAPPPPPPVKRYAVQIGAFGARANAERLAARQRAAGRRVEITPLKRGGKTLYAVWVGAFATRKEARAYGRKRFGAEGKDFKVVERE